MTEYWELASRNVDFSWGDPFQDAVEVPGYSGASTWGFDENTQGYWLSLVPDGGDGSPSVMCGWGSMRLARPEMVMAVLASTMGWDPMRVAGALGLLRLDRAVRGVEEIRQEASDGVMPMGVARWLLGQDRMSPASGWVMWEPVAPTAERVYSEMLFSSASLYLRGSTEGDRAWQFDPMVDAALGWALVPRGQSPVFLVPKPAMPEPAPQDSRDGTSAARVVSRMFRRGDGR